jgi:hypothetical protein
MQVETVSKTPQGSARLVRDRLFHEKLLAALQALMLTYADVYEKLLAAFQAPP